MNTMSKVLGILGISLAIGLTMVAVHTAGYEKGQGEGARDWRVLAETLWVLNKEYASQSKELKECKEDLEDVEDEVCSCRLEQVGGSSFD